MIVGSCFSGCGGMDLAVERAGHEVAWQIEIDTHANQVLRRHWPATHREEDIRHARPADLAPVDLLIGGSPCQDLSVAGRREGLAGERSGLFIDFIRLADAISPRWILFENVLGLLSNQQGEDFAVCLEGFTGWRPAVPEGGWNSAGVCVGPLRWCVWRVLDAQYCGVPQRRRRVFVVAGPRGECRPQILLEPESVSGDPPPSREAGASASSNGRGSVEVVGTLTGGSGPSRLDDAAIGGGHIVADMVQMTHPENRSNPQPGDPSPSVVARGRPVVMQCHGTNVGLLGSLRTGNNVTNGVPFAIADPVSASEGRTYSHEGSNNFRLHNVVGPRPRRLTPRECERLQGLPDDWTRYGDEGDEIADTHRYRLIGNGVAVPCVEWIARRLP